MSMLVLVAGCMPAPASGQGSALTTDALGAARRDGRWSLLLDVDPVSRRDAASRGSRVSAELRLEAVVLHDSASTISGTAEWRRPEAARFLPSNSFVTGRIDGRTLSLNIGGCSMSADSVTACSTDTGALLLTGTFLGDSVVGKWEQSVFGGGVKGHFLLRPVSQRHPSR
jgi:hypothetical protein